jgi:flavin-dependent dehydrogenase
LTGLQTTALIDYGIIPFGYGWIFPKRDHLNVGLGTFRHCRVPLKALLTRHCQERFPGLNLDLPLRGHPIPLYRPPIQGKRALLVGDAGGIVDPLVGEGIYYALRSGELAAQAVSAGLTTGRLEGFRDYERAVASEIIAEFRAASLLATLLYNATAVMHYHLVRKLRIAEQMLTVICGDLTYRQFCSWVLRNMPRELLRSAPAMTEQAFWSAGRIN